MNDFGLLKEKIQSGFTPCLNDNCQLREHCRRWLGRKYISTTAMVVTTVNTGNPLMGGPHCAMFRSDEPARMAYGFTQLLDVMPRKDSKLLFERMVRIYRRTYAYEYRNGTRPLTPEMQQQIAGWCRELVYLAPVVFDKYDDAYEW